MISWIEELNIEIENGRNAQPGIPASMQDLMEKQIEAEQEKEQYVRPKDARNAEREAEKESESIKVAEELRRTDSKDLEAVLQDHPVIGRLLNAITTPAVESGRGGREV